MATKEMKTFAVGTNTYEIVDEYARRLLKDYTDNDINVDIQPLTFTGAVSAEYDGSQAVTVKIPEGAQITDEQANSLWTIIQKTAFVEALTATELTAFKTAWGIVDVTVPATAITLNTTTLSFADTTSRTLTATVEPSDTTDTVVWTSSNSAVATVSNGVVTAISNGSTTIIATAGSVSATCVVTVEIAEEEQVTLTSISATYTGGDVVTGTAVTALTGITVTANYSDGSTVVVTDYTLSGDIVEGENTITVSYGGLTTTFTVTGVTESSGGDTGSDDVGTPIYTLDINAVPDNEIDGTNIEIVNGTIVTSGASAKLNVKNNVPTLANTTTVVEFGDCERQGTAHGRLLLWNTGNEGIIYRNTGLSWLLIFQI